MSDWQAQASNFAKKHNLTHSAGVYALDLISELGEVAKEILKATNYGEVDSPQFNQEQITSELGDVLYSLCLLATAVDVNLDEAFATALHKYETRMQKKGHIGSQE
ncbi:MAG: MazG-like family protein [Chloroflexota bacterium]